MIERVLSDFRVWLREAADVPDERPEPAAEPDWATILQQWTALRHEVNLQTRASRAQLEQNAFALEQLRQTTEMGRHPGEETTDTDERVRPLLKALLEAHDALGLGLREVERLRDVLPTPESALVSAPSFLARLMGAAKLADELTAARQREAKLREQVEAMAAGYRMGVQRLERIIEQAGLETIVCLGRPFDPETMEVAEVVRDVGRATTEVLDEVRRGYRWQGRIFRCAQVRVARP